MTPARRSLQLLALAGGTILLHQFSDLVAGTAGVDMSTPAGRVRLVVAILGRSAGFVAGDVLLLWALAGLGSTAGLRAAAIVHLALGILLLAWVPLFMSDTGHLATTVAGQELKVYRTLVVRSLVLALGMGVVGLVGGRRLLGLGGVPTPAAA